jgi:hypothetical protein
MLKGSNQDGLDVVDARRTSDLGRRRPTATTGGIDDQTVTSLGSIHRPRRSSFEMR